MNDFMVNRPGTTRSVFTDIRQGLPLPAYLLSHKRDSIQDSARLAHLLYAGTRPRCVWRIKRRTLECLVPGSGSSNYITTRSTWTLPCHDS